MTMKLELFKQFDYHFLRLLSVILSFYRRFHSLNRCIHFVLFFFYEIAQVQSSRTSLNGTSEQRGCTAGRLVPDVVVYVFWLA